MTTWIRTGSALAAVLLAACGGSNPSTGSVQFFVEPEDTIPEGLTPGDGEENIADGWTVQYDRYLVAIGNVHASRSAAPGTELREPATYVVDLKNTPPGGFVIARFDDVEATRWDRVGFDLVNATASARKATGLSDADYAELTAAGASLLVKGTMTKADGQSCLPTDAAACVPAPAVTFTWVLKAGTSFNDCAAEGADSGFSVPSGGTVQVKPTIHGDHWFFTNITQGAEVTERRAQWIANSDLDRNGDVTLEELRQVKASDVFTQALGYNLSGAVIPVVTAHDYLEAQARTLGDYQGDGECPTRGVLP